MGKNTKNLPLVRDSYIHEGKSRCDKRWENLRIILRLKNSTLIAQQSNFWPSGGGSEESIEKCFMHDWIEACNLQINLRSDGKLT